MPEKIQKSIDYSNINYTLLSILSIVEGLQLLIITAFLFKLLPPPPNMEQIFLIEHIGVPIPNREMLFYRLFVILTIGFQVLNLLMLRKQLHLTQLFIILRRFFFIEVIILSLMLFWLSRQIDFKLPSIINYLIVGSLGFVFLLKVFWRKVSGFISSIGLRVDKLKYFNLFQRILDFLIPVFIFCSIYIPDIDGLFANLYSIDKLNHIDGFIMSAGWASLKGAVLNVDIFSLYGIGMPILISRLSNILGGFTYQNVLLILMWLIIIYYLSFYVLLRMWLKNSLIAAIGIFLLLKFQMFNQGGYFSAILFPSRTVVRYFFDIFFLISIWLHSKQGKKRYLLVSSFLVGFSLSYLTDGGAHQLIALFAYIFLLLSSSYSRKIIINSYKDVIWMIVSLIFPFVVGFLFLRIYVGQAVYSSQFWIEAPSFIRETVAAGFGFVPFYQNLLDGQYIAFFMSCFVLFVYMFTLVFEGGKFYFKDKKNNEKAFVMILCVYGLSMYHYHIWRSILTNYYVVCGPFVLITCYWCKEAIKNVNVSLAKLLSVCFLIIAFVMLFSTKIFLECPNVFNLKGQNFDINKKFMDVDFQTEKDVDLIKKYTDPSDNVCLISSMETALLMKADRKPFFFQFRFVISTFFLDKKFHGNTLRSKRSLLKALRQLDEERPEYVFIERKLLSGKHNFKHWTGLGIIISYLKDNYVPINKGGNYLLALKRI